MRKTFEIVRCTLLVCVFMSAVGTLRAQNGLDIQEAPDNDAIMVAIMDAQSPYYYPVLFNRYMAGDLTLNLIEYRHLYYGFAWQPQYQPFESPQANISILNLLEKGLNNITDDDCRRLIEYATEVMQTEPFNPSTVNFLTFAHGRLGDTINERINHQRFQMLIRTIQSSGTGVRENSPWHVLYFSHAADVMGHMGVLFGRRTVVSRTTEFIPLLERQGRVRGFYFNFERVYWFRPENMPERPSSGWELNGLPLRRRR